MPIGTLIATLAGILLAVIGGSFGAAMWASDMRHSVDDVKASVDEIRRWARTFDVDYDRRIDRDPVGSLPPPQHRSTP